MKPNNGNTNAGTNNNASTEVKPNNGNTNAGTNNNAGTEVKPNNGNSNSGNDNSNAEENIVHLAYHFEGKDGLTGVKVNIAENPNATVGDYYPLSKDGGDLKYLTDGKARMWVYNKKSVGVDFRGDLLSKHAHLLGEYTQPNNADTEVKPGNNDNTGNNKPENKPAPENKPNNNSNAENTNTNNNVTPSEDIINNIFSNDASGVKVTLTDKTTAVKLSATPVEDKALASSVLEKLNLPADNQIRILDLKLLDKDNHVVDSKANRTVAIVLKEDEKDVAVYHIKDNGELELMKSKIKDGKVTFEINHFSKFAIVSNTPKQNNGNSSNTSNNSDNASISTDNHDATHNDSNGDNSSNIAQNDSNVDNTPTLGHNDSNNKQTSPKVQNNQPTQIAPLNSSVTSNINNSKLGKHLAKTGLSNNNLASLAAIGLVLSGALILGRRKNRK